MSSLPITVSDSFTFSDAASVLRVGVVTRAATDSITLSDATPGIIYGYVQKVEDVITLNDFVTLSGIEDLVPLDVAQTDSIIILDEYGLHYIFNLTSEDSTSISDTPAAIYNTNFETADSVVLSDALNLLAENNIIIIDSLNILDELQSLFSSNLFISDAIDISDLLNLSSVTLINLTDSLDVLDDILIDAAYFLSASDTLTVADYFENLFNILLNIEDFTELYDYISYDFKTEFYPQLSINIGDFISLVDSINLKSIGIMLIKAGDRLIIVDRRRINLSTDYIRNYLNDKLR